MKSKLKSYDNCLTLGNREFSFQIAQYTETGRNHLVGRGVIYKATTMTWNVNSSVEVVPGQN